MQGNGWNRRRDGSAIAGSIAIHLCLLFALAALPPGQLAGGSDPDERTIVASPIVLERAAASPRPRYLAAPSAVAVATPTSRHARAVIAARPHDAHPSRPRQRIAPTIPTLPVFDVTPVPPTSAPSPSHAVALTAPSTLLAASAAPIAPSTPSPGPTPTQKPPAAIGLGNLGDTWEARPMPGMLDALRARIGGHARIELQIDDRGHPVAITIVSGIDDPTLRAQIRTELAAATFIPARCSGIDCAASLTIDL